LLPLREVLLPICFSCCCLLGFATVPAFVPGRLGIMVCCAERRRSAKINMKLLDARGPTVCFSGCSIYEISQSMSLPGFMPVQGEAHPGNNRSEDS
jgi:hypothetical protein